MDTDIKILVVDDFSTMRRIIKNLLKDLGFMNIKEAEDGTEGLLTLKKQPIDLIISDWNMPKLSGVDMVRKIRKDPELKHIPVLMVTAEAKRDQIIEAANAGVNGYIVKPFTSQTLKEKLQKITERS